MSLMKKIFYDKGDVWVETETVTKRRIPESELPPEVREKLNRSSENVVITEELEFDLCK